MRDYSDLDSCIESLKSCNAAYYTNLHEEIAEDGSVKKFTRLVCYSPYVTYDYENNCSFIHCYVYNWVDTFDENGRFISHAPFDGLYLSELDKTI